jgi:hypothetical protein
MSAALAAARKRRGTTEQLPQPPSYGQNFQPTPPANYGQNFQPPPPTNYGQNFQQTSNTQPNAQPNVQLNSRMNSNGLTLQQVISLIDKRLITLEEFMKEQNEMEPVLEGDVKVSSNLNSIVEEFNTRYSILAQEIGTMKDMLIKLQSFTMEVNKTLMDERIRIFSDIESINSTIDMKRTMNFDKLDNIHGFSQKMDYLEQHGEFDIASEIANNQEKLSM